MSADKDDRSPIEKLADSAAVPLVIAAEFWLVIRLGKTGAVGVEGVESLTSVVLLTFCLFVLQSKLKKEDNDND